MALLIPIGAFEPGTELPVFEHDELVRMVQEVRRPVHIVQDGQQNRLGLALAGTGENLGTPASAARYSLMGSLPGLYPQWLGDRAFLETHGLQLPYVTGAMANGIASVRLVEVMSRAGMLGFFGAAGLPLQEVADAVDTLGSSLDGEALPWGSNLIHSPGDVALEEALVALYLERGVRRVSAAAFMGLTPAVVRYAASGLRETPDGLVVRENHLFAKISRPEVARHFMQPAPPALLQRLVERGLLTPGEARLASRVPVAEEITVEADSGGHTDNRPLSALFPIISHLGRELRVQHGYPRAFRLGAAGGLGTPAAVASAFALGASYVLTGSINQAAVESALAPAAKAMLAEVGLADVMMAPSADMFELGAKVQVVRRGTMFAPRAARLHELYRQHDGLEAILPEVLAKVEREILGAPVSEVWEATKRFFQERAPQELVRAERDPKHRMALIFRSYLGLSSRWAIRGDASRRFDYQIWCGPAMGAFNDWVADSFLEPIEAREAVQIALNLLEGAAVVTRAQQLRSYGLPIQAPAFAYRPRRFEV